MAASLDTQEPRLLALAWWWSRPRYAERDGPIDLETLDQWRQGHLGREQSVQVKRSLANDPRLMRMLEELVGADELLAQPDTQARIASARPGARAGLRRWAGQTLSRLFDPLWLGGLVAVTASVLLAVLLLPFSNAPVFDEQLEGVYAALDTPPEELALPWGPKLALRGGARATPEIEADTPRGLAQRAFQAGMAAGMVEVQRRYPSVDLNPGERLHGETPVCAEGDLACRHQVDLALKTGSWALAVYLQCRTSATADQLTALDLLADLQEAWRERAVGHPLGDEVNAIMADQNPCMAVERMLRAWGRS